MRCSLIALAACLGSTACATSVGASFGRSSPFGSSTPAVVSGARVSQLAQIDRDEGPVFGYELELASQTFNQPGFAWRAQGQVGWADTPHAYKDRVGREITLRVGYARFPLDEQSVHAFVIGPRFAAPVRLGGPEDPWQADDVAASTWMLVPEMGGNVALAPGHGLRFDFALALSVRLHLWTALSP